ncbi:MAG: restriction endonuclease subunit S [Endozoicomonas sp. (ex Botrylloides leachii)]|nr:restriction endonuclease subunit S [Endozoicomonas sp. (ex Botrylloides leachii)]
MTKTVTPNLRFPEFESPLKQSTLGDVIQTLESGVSVNAEDSTPAEDQKGILKTSAVIRGNFLPVESKVIVDVDEADRASLNPKQDTVIISRMNTPALVGESGYVDQDYPLLFVPDRLWMASTNDDNSTKWLSLLIISPRARYQISSKATGTSNSMKNISKPSFLSIDAWVPELPEQQKIAAFLSKVDEKIVLLTEKKDKLTEYKKGVMQQLFNGRWETSKSDPTRTTFIPPTLRFKADDGSEFPAWEEKQGGELFETISNKNHNSDLPVLAITQNQGAIPRDLINYKISVEQKSVSSYKVVEKGDFIISLRSFQGGIEYSRYTGICSPAYVVLRPRLEVEDDFYKHYLKTYPFIIEMQKRLEGIRDGKIISYKYFSEIKIPCPPVAEQVKINNFLKATELKISIISNELDSARQWKKGLLQQMFV